ncbi:MAG: transglutaminase-like domain-containing protein [Verrucomicrobiota bacterium]
MNCSGNTLPYLLRLLDDDQPDVRREVTAQLSTYGGDLSDQIAGLGIELPPADRDLLSEILRPARRDSLRETWFTPSRSLTTPDGDWEGFESFLRMLSDYLHDGIFLRPSLSDALDELAEESSALDLNDPIPLAQWLFDSERLAPNRLDYYNPKNSDLAEVLETGLGNPLSLCLVLILVAQRRDIPIFGCNYPGHFLCWTDTSSGPLVIDPYNCARTLPVKQILSNNPGLSENSKKALSAPCSQLDILQRMLSNLSHAYTKLESPDDIALMRELLDSVEDVQFSIA